MRTRPEPPAPGPRRYPFTQSHFVQRILGWFKRKWAR